VSHPTTSEIYRHIDMDPDPGWLTADEVAAAEQQFATQQHIPPARQGIPDPRERGQGKGQNRQRRNGN